MRYFRTSCYQLGQRVCVCVCVWCVCVCVCVCVCLVCGVCVCVCECVCVCVVFSGEDLSIHVSSVCIFICKTQHTHIFIDAFMVLRTQKYKQLSLTFTRGCLHVCVKLVEWSGARKGETQKASISHLTRRNPKMKKEERSAVKYLHLFH